MKKSDAFKRGEKCGEMFLLVLEEMEAQFHKWGEQTHPMVTAHPPRLYAKTEQMWKAINDDSVEKGTLGWDGILMEEAYEACAEENPEKREAELIQVAAVAIQAVLDSRRQRGL